MNDLLQLAIRGNGGAERWAEISRFRASMAIKGAIWALKGKAGALDDVVLTGDTRAQRLTIAPFPAPGQVTTWEPAVETVRDDDGTVLAQRQDPAASFLGHTRRTPWDDLHVAYFAGEANWNYFVTPFLFARPDFVVEEIDPWHEDGEVWRSLQVTYPDSIVAHTRQQTYRFDDAGLLRRLDYRVDILGGGPAVHYPSEYREFDGIQVPTRRLVHVRNPDGTPVRSSTSIAIDVTDVSFS